MSGSRRASIGGDKIDDLTPILIRTHDQQRQITCAPHLCAADCRDCPVQVFGAMTVMDWKQDRSLGVYDRNMDRPILFASLTHHVD